MSRFRSFVDFWLMREMGQEDAVFRNYDLLWACGQGVPDLHMWLGLRRAGIPNPSTKNIQAGMDQLAQWLVDCGIERPAPDTLMWRLVAWYTWDRIREGEVQQFMLRSRKR